jgi:hypothetical protein
MLSKEHFLAKVLHVFSIVLVFLFSLGFAHAQFSAGDSIGASLETNPKFPGPNESVQVSLNAYSINTTGARVTWYVDDKKLEYSQNERSIRVTTGDIGEKTTVRAVISFPNGNQLPLSVTFSPVDVHVILEASTYVPLFYLGRALPSESSLVRAIAIPLMGTNVDVKTLSYAWKHNGSALFGGPVKGKQSIELRMPKYQGDVLTVEVFDERGKVLGNKAIVLNPSEPLLRFYEDNPLRGMNHRAIQGSFTLIGEEATIRAVPYFMDTDMNTNTVSFEWLLDGMVVRSNSEPNTVTLRKIGVGGGEASLDLRVLLKRTMPQYLTGSMGIIFR